jgi:Major capsid protein N-terminus
VCTGNPQITFFKVVYRRHTNFAIESIEQTFNGTVDFNRKVTCTVSRNGDLIHRAYLQVTLPALTNTGKTVCWTRRVGEVLIDYVNIEIGGQEIAVLSVSKNEFIFISKRIILPFFCNIIKLRGHPKAEWYQNQIEIYDTKVKIHRILQWTIRSQASTIIKIVLQLRQIILKKVQRLNNNGELKIP